ncbi:glutathione S-transferase N-terminal domain-containing protein [Alphaproteobacteria bacterium]|nr:glutathione S-transferase N-terminal domain-containing protein [Alphaproteobacteria bacterium]
MIELYTWPTPNGRKITIMLEELQVAYKIFPININDNEQYSEKFSKISPSNKIPAIIDCNNNKSIFESGAIMLYLANKYNKFIPNNFYWETIEWLIFQTSQVGPLLGQAHQFLFYQPNQSKFVEEKYINYAKRIYQTLDNKLQKYEYLANEYSIADISTWPWIARFQRHRIELQEYPNVLRWYLSIKDRPAVIKGYNIIGEKEEIPC